MEEIKKYVEIEDFELARLQRLDGRVDAAQNLVDEADYVCLDDVLLVLGIDTTKMKTREKKRAEKYNKDKEREGNAGTGCEA